jgi:hypothetical protein
VTATIVGGYGKERYKAEFIKVLVYSLGSNDETIDHLDNLYNIDHYDLECFNKIHTILEIPGKKINLFIKERITQTGSNQKTKTKNEQKDYEQRNHNKSRRLFTMV